MTMTRLIACFALVLTLTVGFAAVTSATDDICQKGDLDYTNNSGSSQTIYVTAFDQERGETVGDSREVGSVGPGETLDRDVELDAPDDGDVIFIYSTESYDDDQSNVNPIDQTAIDPCRLFNDGRLNPHHPDAPAIVYNVNNQFIDVYVFNAVSNVGNRTVSIPYADVTATLASAAEAGENQLIEENFPVAVYALSSGTCQMNFNGTVYVFEWNCALQP